MWDRGNEERPIKMRHQACISPDTKSQVYFSVLITFGYLISFQIILCIVFFFCVTFYHRVLQKISTDLLQLFPSIKASNPKSFDDQINAFTRGPGPPCVVENPCGFQAPVRWWTRGKALNLRPPESLYIYIYTIHIYIYMIVL